MESKAITTMGRTKWKESRMDKNFAVNVPVSGMRRLTIEILSIKGKYVKWFLKVYGFCRQRERKYLTRMDVSPTNR